MDEAEMANSVGNTGEPLARFPFRHSRLSSLAFSAQGLSNIPIGSLWLADGLLACATTCDAIYT
jgi:hypothetical protein